MRIVTWNCGGGGFRSKAARMARLRPDVLIVQEVEELDRELFLDGDEQPSFRWRLPVNGSRRGIALLSYTGVELRPAFDEAAPFEGFYPFEARLGDLEFNVAAVWTFATDGGVRTSYKQAHAGLERFSGWLSSRPSIVLGDFNNNATYESGRPWRSLLDRTEPLGLVSAYHEFFGEQYGQETRPTHYHKGHETSPWHLDYCFIPSAWRSKLLGVDVGDFAQWQGVSDHRPVMIDLDLGARG